MTAARKDPGKAGRPTLSVVTPSFESTRFIDETLDSVAALQTPHEHLVIDGGSSDGTAELLEARQDPALSWISEPDRGQTHAVNKGLSRATGDLIAWLNADDGYIAENVDKAIELLLRDPDADAVFGFIDIVDERGEHQKQYRCGPFNWTRYLYFGEYLPTPTIIFKRRLLKRAPTLDERWADSADYDFYLRLLRGTKVLRMRSSLVRFRYHENSKTASNPQLQRREGLAIRTGHARSSIEKSLMRMLDRVSSVRNALIQPWPEMRER